MKKATSNLFSIITAVVVIFFVSCKKDESTSSNGGGTASSLTSFSFTIENNNYTQTDDQYIFAYINNSCGSSYLYAEVGPYNFDFELEGVIANGAVFNLLDYSNPASMGSLYVEEHIDTLLSYYYSTDHPSSSGQLTIINYNEATRTITGTFSANLFGEDMMGNQISLSINNGNFKIKPFSGPYAGNTFSGSINNQPLSFCSSSGVNSISPTESYIEIFGESNNFFDYGYIKFPNSVVAGSTVPNNDVYFSFSNSSNYVSESNMSAYNLNITSHDFSNNTISGTLTGNGFDDFTGDPVTINSSFNIKYDEYGSNKMAIEQKSHRLISYPHREFKNEIRQKFNQ